MLSAMTVAQNAVPRRKMRTTHSERIGKRRDKSEDVVRAVKAGWALERGRYSDKGKGRFEARTFSLV